MTTLRAMLCSLRQREGLQENRDSKNWTDVVTMTGCFPVLRTQPVLQAGRTFVIAFVGMDEIAVVFQHHLIAEPPRGIFGRSAR